MKLISLNTWGGQAGKEGLIDFFRKHKDVDFFCLQEIWHGGEEIAGKEIRGHSLVNVQPTLLKDISEVLPEHNVYFKPHFRDFCGLAIWVKKEFLVLEEGEIFVYQERGYESSQELGDHSRNLQYLTVEKGDKSLTIINFHGLWNNQGKDDSSDRLVQSNNIYEFIKGIPHPYVLTGDFNLLPETESLKKLESLGLRNLIKEFGITSTRTSFYQKPIKFADYTLTHPDIQINDFKVLPDEVSDHAALYLNFQ